jgi:hypothetical protein
MMPEDVIVVLNLDRPARQRDTCGGIALSALRVNRDRPVLVSCRFVSRLWNVKIPR